MSERDLKFASWVISITSILYGILSLAVMSRNGYSDGYYGWIANSGFIPLPFILLIIFGILKLTGIIVRTRTIRRVAIVGLMLCWGFVWTSSLMSFITLGPNRTVITSLPIIAISAFIAMRGDYSE